MKYRSEIDGLRTLAVVPVILFHAGFAGFSGGFVGVDVFFVISGYLITTIIINELEQGKFSLGSFYERRARRILPALFFVMFACIPFAWLLMLPGELQDFSQSVMAVATFSSNVLFWLESGYFERAAELKPLLHTWSLAVEEQYYILFPLFLMLTWRLGRRRILLLLGLVFLLSLALAQWATTASPDAAFFLLPTRGWELLVGVFVAFYLQHQAAPRSMVLDQTGSILGLVLLVVAVVAFDEQTPFPGFYALVPTLGTALLILYANSGTWAHRLLSLPLLVGIGLISYSAYLWHQPLLVFARLATAENPSLLLVSAMCVAAFVLAGFSYRYVEKPFRNRQFLPTRQIFTGALTLMLVFVATGLMMMRVDANLDRYTTNGFAGDIGHDEFHDFVQNTFVPCQPPELYAQAETWDGFVRCQQSQEQAQHVVLFGDSHAEHLFIGLAEALEELNIVYFIRAGYPFVGESNFDYLIDYITDNEDINLVVFAAYWHRTATVFGEQEFRRKLQATVDVFNAAGKQVLLVGDVPDFQFDPANCNYQNRFRLSACEIDYSQLQHQKSVYQASLQSVAQNAGAELVTIDDLFCNGQSCSMVKDATLMFRDNDHLNIPASRQVGAVLLERSVLLSTAVLRGTDD